MHTTWQSTLKPKVPLTSFGEGAVPSCSGAGGRILLNTEVNTIHTETRHGELVATGITGLHFNGSPKPDALTFTARTAVVSDVNLPRTIEMTGREAFPEKFLNRIEKFNISDSVHTLANSNPSLILIIGALDRILLGLSVLL